MDDDRMIIMTFSMAPRLVEEAVEEFLRDDYLPAIRMGPTRVGQILGLRLWRNVDDPGTATSRFLLEVRFSGYSHLQPHIEDPDVEARFETRGVSVERLGAFNLVAERFETAG
jgi:hypothetical protein